MTFGRLIRWPTAFGGAPWNWAKALRAAGVRRVYHIRLRTRNFGRNPELARKRSFGEPAGAAAFAASKGRRERNAQKMKG